jgi:serine phosphatase RsbU (regulator of sigma subunit)
MRLLGRWSLASFMRVVVNASYYFLIVLVSTLGIAIAFWIALTPGHNVSMTFEMPVRFELDPAAHRFVTARHDVQAVSVTQAQGTLQITARASSMIGIAWPGFVYAIITLGMVLFVLNRLRAIFRSLSRQNPFAAPNASRVRMIGMALVLGELARAGPGAWYAARLTREISVTGLTFKGDMFINTWVIFSGLILLMLAEVFRLGSEMKGDLEAARKIQFSLVPGEIFCKKDVVVHARMLPAKIVGGDYYDVLELDERRLAVIVGDVAGKGLPAAMLMASVAGSVRALCSAGLRGSELITALNRHVRTTTSDGRFVTLFYGEVDSTTGEMMYVNAGHNPPILLRSDGRLERLQPTAMVLGVVGNAGVEARHVEIKPADRLLLFTDGFPEAFNKGDEAYGEERLTESFVRARTLPSSVVVERLITDVLSFCGSVQPQDDMTLMLVGREVA